MITNITKEMLNEYAIDYSSEHLDTENQDLLESMVSKYKEVEADWLNFYYNQKGNEIRLKEFYNNFINAGYNKNMTEEEIDIFNNKQHYIIKNVGSVARENIEYAIRVRATNDFIKSIFKHRR